MSVVPALGEPADPGLQPRVCGRCRVLFEGDPTLPAAALPTWWVCPDCRTALLPHGTKSDEVVVVHRAAVRS